jgi:hypothetical protein
MLGGGQAGVLLSIPALETSGVLSVARKIYGTIGPAFYGLRTTLVTYILLALLRIPRPETLKEYAPNDLGRIVGLEAPSRGQDTAPQAGEIGIPQASQQFGREMAQGRVEQRGRVLSFFNLDGRVRAYHGKHTIPKGYLTRTRMAVAATTDYWGNDPKGDPLFVVSAEANAP